MKDCPNCGGTETMVNVAMMELTTDNPGAKKLIKAENPVVAMGFYCLDDTCHVFVLESEMP